MKLRQMPQLRAGTKRCLRKQKDEVLVLGGRALHRALPFVLQRVLKNSQRRGRWRKAAEDAEKDLVILQKRVAGLSEATLERFVLRARRAAGLRGTVNVLVTSGAVVRSLNRQFRGKNKTTDVLSFPSPVSAIRGAARLVGDIAISADIAAQNARQLGHSPTEEVEILTLHGILHLAGFDHERDNGEMARKELRLRQELRLPVGLIERAELTKRGSLTHPSISLRAGSGHKHRAGARGTA